MNYTHTHMHTLNITIKCKVLKKYLPSSNSIENVACPLIMFRSHVTLKRSFLQCKRANALCANELREDGSGHSQSS